MFQQRDVVFVFYLAGRLRPGVGFVNAECAGFILPSPPGTGSSSKIFWLTGLRILSFEFLVFSSNGSNSKLKIKN